MSLPIMPHALLHSLLLAAVIAAIAGLSGCKSQADQGTDPTGTTALPTLTVRADTPDLLFTWIDEDGGTHTSVSIGEIPKDRRQLVRVISKTAGHGQTFYVADLREAKPDGTYAVSTMPRGTWEGRLDNLRRAKRQPKTEAPVGANGSVSAVVYGADWCGPCHQAKAYLQRKGVPVAYHDIEKHPRYGVEMRKKLAKAGIREGSIPVLDIGGVLLRGYNPRAIDRTLERLKPKPGHAPL